MSNSNKLTRRKYQVILSEVNEKSLISFSKSRISGSKQSAYFMHSKSGCMPGVKERFTTTSLSRPNKGEPIRNNNIINAFKRERYLSENHPIGRKFIHGFNDQFTFMFYPPYDDEAFYTALNICYRQVYGNFNAMESEKPRDSERRLRNGDITIREFVRQLAKSTFYKRHYLEKVSQKKFIEYNFMHIMGRPLHDQNELINHIELINNEGADSHIDSLVDSIEYTQIFGDDIVPFNRGWESTSGSRTINFLDTVKSSKGFAGSDNINQAIK